VTGGGCARIPEETAGPFPADGSNGPNVLTQSGVVRRDIRPSFGSMTGRARGIPLTIRLRVQDVSGGCDDLAGAAVYLWHCDRVGRYSLYSAGATNRNWLRGVQVTDRTGRVTFRSIFPGCYPGRWPHAHFEVYRSLDEATAGEDPVVTSQLALPKRACQAVYANRGYAASRANLRQLSLAGDGIFADGWRRQLANTSGSNRDGWTAKLTFGVP
jgi:protocatechuate 3,4-dioxygenase beta subunit